MEELTRAKKRALYLLTDMDRTEKELCDKLKKSGYSEETIAAVMQYVSGFGYIDDSRYCDNFIRIYSRKESRKQIRFKLMKKGVDPEIIDGAFDRAGEADERPLIRQLAEKKLRTLKEDDVRAGDKLAASLCRKGFQISDIISVMNELGLNS